MSTSYSPALEPAPEAEVRPFPYLEVQADGGSGAPSLSGGPSVNIREQARREEAAHEAGRRAGEIQGRASLEDQLAGLRDGVRVALDEFAGERARYHQRVEAEVVQLAFGIARKILHREAQLDPLLLAGMVRVALDQIEHNTKVVVRVHPQQSTDWRGFFARSMDPQDVPEIVDDPTLAPDRCVLQTELGTTELGIEVQLKEIERGLLDLLAHRPGTGT